MDQSEHVVTTCVTFLLMCAYDRPLYITSRESHFWWTSLLWCAIDGVSAKALWSQCFNENTSNVSYVDNRELGNWSKVMPLATMWQCFRVIMCKVCMHIMIELAACLHVHELAYICMSACRMQADAKLHSQCSYNWRNVNDCMHAVSFNVVPQDKQHSWHVLTQCFVLKEDKRRPETSRQWKGGK